MSKVSKIVAKINPFKYQNTIHERIENPRKYSDYRKFKPHLRKEFDGKCIYCRKPTLPTDDPSSFHVEHYRPKSKFPMLKCEYTNLYYSCASCNRNKGTFWDDKLRVANPCDYIMSHHLKFDRHRVVANSRTGELTEELLQLNSTISASYREYLETAIRALVAELLNPPKRLRGGDRLAYAEAVQKSVDALSCIVGISSDDLKKQIK